MSHPANEALIEQKMEQLEEWLADFDLRLHDVLQDSDGRYYINNQSENGTSGDDYEVENNKVYLPDEFQSLSL